MQESSDVIRTKGGRRNRKTDQTGKVILDLEGKPDINKMLEQWTLGAVQNISGKAVTQFIADFLNTFSPELRDSMEIETKSLYDVETYKRFRKKMLLNLAVAYHNGAVAQKNGENIDVSQMMRDAIKTTEKAEGW